ncbi:MAG: hypothetical protein HOV94_08270, partial [Saccharothrix sp.]|nr:hypothetical protein [Saccharothrix sp.]
LALCTRYTPRFGRLDVPVLALAGDDDPIAPAAGVARWREVVTGPVRLRAIPGGHDFPYRQAGAVAALITRHPDVRRVLEARAGVAGADTTDRPDRE